MTWNSTLRPDLYRDILISTVVDISCAAMHLILYRDLLISTVVDNEKVALFYKQYIV